MSLDRPPIAVRRPRSRDPLILGLGAVVVALAGIAAALATRSNKDGDDPFPVRIVITLDADDPIGSGVLSPDGHSVVDSAWLNRRNRGGHSSTSLDVRHKR